jgi:general secretion pathway protein G
MAQRSMNQHQRSRGFTLVELLVVITIIGIIGTYVTVNVVQYIESAKRVKSIEAIVALKGQCDIYKIHKGKFPETLEKLTEPSKMNSDESYVKKIPKDPFGNEYVYKVDGKELELMSKGADGQDGTEDDITLEKIEDGEYSSDNEDE